MSFLDSKERSVVSVLFIAEINWPFLRTNQSPEPVLKPKRKLSRVVGWLHALMGTEEPILSILISDEVHGSVAHTFRNHSKIQFLPYRIHV